VRRCSLDQIFHEDAAEPFYGDLHLVAVGRLEASAGDDEAAERGHRMFLQRDPPLEPNAAN
jgi:hypothetical protein